MVFWQYGVLAKTPQYHIVNPYIKISLYRNNIYSFPLTLLPCVYQIFIIKLSVDSKVNLNRVILYRYIRIPLVLKEETTQQL